jgi:hypothetical protein
MFFSENLMDRLQKVSNGVQCYKTSCGHLKIILQVGGTLLQV